LAAFPFDRDVVEVLVWCRQQIVEAVDLWLRVGQAPAAPHHRVEVVRVFSVKREKQRDDRVPRVGSSCTDDVAGHFTLG
jgi:hypothetical protein